MVDKAKFATEEGHRLSIFGRHILVTDAMKQYAQEKLLKIERLTSHLMDIHVTMDIQKLEHTVDIVVKFEHFKIKVHAASTDMYASIDKAVDRLRTLMARWKDRIQNHHRKALSAVELEVNLLKSPYDEVAEINAELEALSSQQQVRAVQAPRVVGKKTIPLKQLTTDEAMMKMELSGDHFLIFRGEEDRKLKVIYRCDDEHAYGIVQAE